MLNGSCIVWHVLRRYGTQRLAYAAWNTRTCTVQPEFPDEASKVGFDVQKIASGCMHTVLSRHCQRTGADPSTGKAVINIIDVQDEWTDLFPAPHLWHDCSGLTEQGRKEWSSDQMLEACRGLALPQSRDGGLELRILFETHLPPSVKKRFEVLFSVKDTWSKDEIEPYLDIHDCDCSSPTELLLRYSRTIRDGTTAPPIYCAR